MRHVSDAPIKSQSIRRTSLPRIFEPQQLNVMGAIPLNDQFIIEGVWISDKTTHILI